MYNVLMIVGSLRRGSLNRQLAQEAERLLAGRADVTWMDYADVPHMNQDAEHPAPLAVTRVRDQVRAADGLWIVSAEYNASIPGMLKNLLDWLSRPAVPNDWQSGTVLAGKPVTIAGCGGGNATAGMRHNLAQLLRYLHMDLVADEGTGVVLSADALASDTLGLSDKDRAKLATQADLLLDAMTVGVTPR